MKRTALSVAGLAVVLLAVELADGQAPASRFSRKTGFERYDVNGDGKLTRDEVRSSYQDWFKEFDTDGNGTWSRAEYDHFNAVARKELTDRTNRKTVTHETKEIRLEVVAGGLSNPCGVAVQPKTGHVFVSDSAAGRVVRVVKGKLQEVITGFPTETYGKGPKYKIGPLGLLFLDEKTLVVGGGGRKDGEDRLSVFQIGPAGSPSVTADKAVSTHTLPGSDARKGEGNFYGLARIERYLYVTCNGDDTKGWIARATIKDNKITRFERLIPSKLHAELDAPVALATTMRNSLRSTLIVGQAGEVNVPGDSKMLLYGPTGKHRQTIDTGMHDITGIATFQVYSTRPDIGTMIAKSFTYAIDFAWIRPEEGGLYVVDQDRASRKTVKRRLFKLDRPTAMAVSEDETSLYITTVGRVTKVGQKGGQLVKVVLHEKRPNPVLALAARARAPGGRFGAVPPPRIARPARPAGRFGGGPPGLPPNRAIFTRFDKDMDGNITKKEAGANWASLQRFDQDGNGIIDLGEFDAATQAPPARNFNRNVAPGRAAGLPADVAKRFIDRYDTNKDGAITEKEMGAPWKSFSARMDANKDGKITIKELQTGAFAPRARPAPRGFGARPAGRGFGAPAARAFGNPFQVSLEAYDKNKDKKLSVQEMGALWNTVSIGDTDKDGKLNEQEFEKLTRGTLGTMLRLWQRFDHNRDGIVTKDEMSRSWNTYGRYDIDGDNKLTAEEYARRSLVRSDPFAAYDRNKDGKLTKQEIGGQWERIAKYDLNKDGSVPRAEFDKGVEQFGPLGRRASGIDAPPRGRGAPPAARDREAAAKSVMRRMDTNGDGIVEEKEAERSWPLFGRYDANQDGKLTLQELIDRRTVGGPRRTRTQPPKTEAKPKKEAKPSKETRQSVAQKYIKAATGYLKSLDKNGDGVLDKAEQAGMKFYKNSDHDKNGKITADELAKTMANSRK